MIEGLQPCCRSPLTVQRPFKIHLSFKVEQKVFDVCRYISAFIKCVHLLRVYSGTLNTMIKINPIHFNSLTIIEMGFPIRHCGICGQRFVGHRKKCNACRYSGGKVWVLSETKLLKNLNWSNWFHVLSIQARTRAQRKSTTKKHRSTAASGSPAQATSALAAVKAGSGLMHTNAAESIPALIARYVLGVSHRPSFTAPL